MRILDALKVAGLGLAAIAASAGADESVFKSDAERTAYAVGVQTARNLRKDGIEVDLEMLVRGLKDGLGSEKLLIGEKDLRQIMNSVQTEMRRHIAANRRVLGEENRKIGSDFLAANAKRDGVVTLPSGVQYRVLKSGNGRVPDIGDQVVVHYRGTRLDGFEFDASPAGKPATLPVGQLISGWKEALLLMPAGSKWELAVPSQQAYGERGVGQDIGPNQTLLFDVELLDVK